MQCNINVAPPTPVHAHACGRKNGARIIAPDLRCSRQQEEASTAALSAETTAGGHEQWESCGSAYSPDLCWLQRAFCVAILGGHERIDEAHVQDYQMQEDHAHAGVMTSAGVAR